MGAYLQAPTPPASHRHGREQTACKPLRADPGAERGPRGSELSTLATPSQLAGQAGDSCSLGGSEKAVERG